jgi:hypothetical protein
MLSVKSAVLISRIVNAFDAGSTQHGETAANDSRPFSERLRAVLLALPAFVLKVF